MLPRMDPAKATSMTRDTSNQRWRLVAVADGGSSREQVTGEPGRGMDILVLYRAGGGVQQGKRCEERKSE